MKKRKAAQGAGKVVSPDDRILVQIYISASAVAKLAKSIGIEHIQYPPKDSAKDGKEAVIWGNEC